MKNDLLDDVKNLLDESIEFLSYPMEDLAGMGYNLSLENPVMSIPVPGGWRIITLDSLQPAEKAQLIAHELAHLQVKGEGLFTVSMGDEFGPEAILAGEINNVIFHHFIINRLEKEYGIGNDVHLAHRKKILENGQELMDEYSGETIQLHCIGLHLLDLAITTKKIMMKRLIGCSNCPKKQKKLLILDVNYLFILRKHYPLKNSGEELRNFYSG